MVSLTDQHKLYVWGLGHTKLISYSTECQGNILGSVGSKDMISFPIESNSYFLF